MKKLTLIVALTMVISISMMSSVRSETMESEMDEKLAWWYHPYYPPYLHRWPRYLPKPKPAAAHPPLPAHHFPQPPPEVTKCWSDCKDLRVCHAAIVKAFFTRNPDLGEDCCAAILKMHEDCEKLILGAFHNPFFNCFIKLHCAAHSGGASAPSPA